MCFSPTESKYSRHVAWTNVHACACLLEACWLATCTLEIWKNISWNFFENRLNIWSPVCNECHSILTYFNISQLEIWREKNKFPRYWRPQYNACLRRCHEHACMPVYLVNIMLPIKTPSTAGEHYHIMLWYMRERHLKFPHQWTVPPTRNKLKAAGASGNVLDLIKWVSLIIGRLRI